MTGPLHRFLSRFSTRRGRQDPHRLEILKGSLTALLLRALDAFLAFLFNLVLARALGVEGTGAFSLALTATSVAALFGRMGLDNAVLRFTATHAARGDRRGVRGLFRSWMGLVLPVSLAFSVSLYLLAPLLATTLFKDGGLTPSFRAAALCVTPLVLSFLLGQALRGLKLIRDYLLVEGILPAAFALALLFPLSPYGPAGALWAFALGHLLAAAWGLLLWRRALPQGPSRPFPLPRLLESAVPTFWSLLLIMLLQWVPTIVLGATTSQKEVALFSTAFQVSLVVVLMPLAVSGITSPKFAVIHGKGQLKLLERTASYSCRLSAWTALGPLLLFLAFPRAFMGWFGPGFEAAAPCLAVLAVGQFVGASLGPTTNLLMMTGHERSFRDRTLASAILGVALSLALIPAWGAFGAALATALSLAAGSLLSAWLVRRKLGVWVLPFPTGGGR